MENIKQVYELYFDSLSEKEKKAYMIAKTHLGMSFQVEKSLGFIKWYSTYQLANADSVTLANDSTSPCDAIDCLKSL
jgi:hypothetical protein